MSGVIEAAKVVAAGRSFLDGVAYSMHVGNEGRDGAAVRATIDDDERRRYYRITPFGAAVARAEARRLAHLVRLARAGSARASRPWPPTTAAP